MCTRIAKLQWPALYPMQIRSWLDITCRSLHRRLSRKHKCALCILWHICDTQEPVQGTCANFSELYNRMLTVFEKIQTRPESKDTFNFPRAAVSSSGCMLANRWDIPTIPIPILLPGVTFSEVLELFGN